MMTSQNFLRFDHFLICLVERGGAKRHYSICYQKPRSCGFSSHTACNLLTVVLSVNCFIFRFEHPLLNIIPI